jgi:hypothetical protein
MRLSAIRHIATSYRGTRLVAGAFERLVSVWDLDNERMVSKFETCFDTGGTRLAISEDGSTVAAGSYNLNLIGLHRSQGGSIIWKRKVLRKFNI